MLRYSPAHANTWNCSGVGSPAPDCRRGVVGRQTAGEFAESTGASTSSVSRWKQPVEQGNLDALAAKLHQEKRPMLSDAENQELLQVLAQWSRAAGYNAEL